MSSTARMIPKHVQPGFDPSETYALRMDAEDPLRKYRDEFHIPKRSNGEPVIYFAGNSLGLQPKKARSIVEQELDDWAKLAVDAHFKGKTPWYSYHEVFKESGARLVGALPGAGEVVMMNSLTVNLHLMMVSFYQPTAERYKILIEEPCFPSDMYAVQSHLRSRGIDPKQAILLAKPPPGSGNHCIDTEVIEQILEREGKSIALVQMGGVNFLTGQAFDIPRITTAAHRQGCMVGWDLAHAAGNLALQLHDWNVDFAAWCSYKYLNAGPGSVAGCFVHERHGKNLNLTRYAGWWGNDPATRFKMQLIPEFQPREGADGWQVSNPPILSMAPLKASLELFDAAGIQALRAKSLKLTGYLRSLLESSPPQEGGIEIITPRADEAHGCQLSILVKDQPRDRFKALEHAGVVCDFREPNVIRVAPTPLYNTFHEVWRFAQVFTA